jgi:molybdenum cofactor guanylyltransferase
MPERNLVITGFVLAGGASRRMGRPKHRLIIGNVTLLARTVRLARSIARTVAVIGPPGLALDLAGATSGFEVRVLPDLVPGRGPLAAILTALSLTPTEFNLVLSCDLPFMPARFLRYLAAQALDSQADVTLAETPSQGYQPLAAIYRRRARTVVRASLQGGNNKVARFFPRVRVRLLRWPELARARFQPFVFDNLNTPEDYQRALCRTEASGRGEDESGQHR